MNWSYKPPKGPKPRKIDGPSIVMGNHRTSIPASTSKDERAQTGGFARGLGNNVCNHGGKYARNYNPVEPARLQDLSAGEKERRKNYANLRATDAYKLQRAKAKRMRKQPTFGRIEE